MIEYGVNTVGKGSQIFEPVTLGFPSRDKVGQTGFIGTTIGINSVIRSGTIIYCDVSIGDNFQRSVTGWPLVRLLLLKVPR
jgi:UDP-3-O-[3-hydroxymyristoyl] glucosamine N-acyltransferase